MALPAGSPARVATRSNTETAKDCVVARTVVVVPVRPSLRGTPMAASASAGVRVSTIPTRISLIIAASLHLSRAIAPLRTIRQPARAFSCSSFACLLQTTSYFSRVFRSARPTTCHNRVTIATVMIHRSNLARSIANSMSAAKRIERDTIRLIMRAQIQQIRRRQPEFS
jgi:hypothetical protein